MQVTFHRAFDITPDPIRAFEDVISMGIDRILTSGQAASAWDGVPMIKKLIQLADGRISIMPGSGVNEDNVVGLLRKTGAREVHASLRSRVNSRMEFKPSKVSMGAPATDNYTWRETDPERVKTVLEKIRDMQL
jgi:copper homeostasis protein